MAMPQYSEDESNPDIPEGGTDPTTEGTPATEGEAPQGRTDTMFIHPDMLGGLDPESINAGDILEFKVVGRDADGDIEVEYNTGDNKSPMEKVTSDFRAHMMGGSEGGGNPDSGGY